MNYKNCEEEKVNKSNPKVLMSVKVNEINKYGYIIPFDLLKKELDVCYKSLFSIPISRNSEEIVNKGIVSMKELIGYVIGYELNNEENEVILEVKNTYGGELFESFYLTPYLNGHLNEKTKKLENIELFGFYLTGHDTLKDLGIIDGRILNMKVYLSGNVKEEVYRNYVLEKYSDRLLFCEPIRDIGLRFYSDFNWKSYWNHEIDIPINIARNIIEKEKKEILKCNILTAYMEIYSAGTIMEIQHAYNHHIPTYIIDPTKEFRKDLWLKYHTLKFHDTIDDCFNYLCSINEKDNEIWIKSRKAKNKLRI